METCFHCQKKIYLKGHKVGDKLFCSKNCAAYFKAQNGFCENCLAETTAESTGNLWMFNGIGTGLGVFPKKNSECPTCGSVIKRKWFFFGFPIVPYDQYRVINLTDKHGLGGEDMTFLTRKLKNQNKESVMTNYKKEPDMTNYKIYKILLIAASVVCIAGFVLNVTVSSAVTQGRLSDDIIGFGGMLIGMSSIFGIIISWIYSKKLNCNPLGWCVGALCFPYIIPLVLAFKKPVDPMDALKHLDNKQITGMLVDTFRDMAICSKCQKGYNLADLKGKELVCDSCGHKLLKFYPSTKGQKCAECGFKFTDEPIDMNTIFGDIISGGRKGFKCYSCGKVICANCARKADTKTAFTCHCGGELAVQI